MLAWSRLRRMPEGRLRECPASGPRSSPSTTRQRAMNFYVWESADAAKSFFSAEVRKRVTGLYGVEPVIDFVEIAQLVDNSSLPPKE